jgi:hypothetical protein
MKFIAERPDANPEVAARKLLEIANSIEAVQDGRIHIEKINALSCTSCGARRLNTRPSLISRARLAVAA